MKAQARLLLPMLSLALALVACEGERKRDSGTTRPPTPPGGSDCGNGRVDTGETCDRAIPNGAGACISDCFDGIACTSDTRVGTPEACNVTCAFTRITACANGDGCCPESCTGANDSDCSSSCGNATVDAAETCDGNCPASCDDRSACTTDTAYGSASSCSYACGYQVTAMCAPGDGCCPAGCNSTTDSDCSATCGNAMRDEKETCDGDCPTSCADAIDCTVDVMIGSASTCNVECLHQTISQCRAGDGCCPAGCVNATDSDCSSLCGNNMIDSGETCDGETCPTTCTPDGGNACTRATLIGSASNCSAECRYEMITTCTAGDGCCPATCNDTTDTDCVPAPPIGVGSACTMAGDCGTLVSGETSYCLLDGFPGGYCSIFCTSAMCPSGSQCDVNYHCVKECSSNADCRGPQYTCQHSFDRFEQSIYVCLPIPPP